MRLHVALAVSGVVLLVLASLPLLAGVAMLGLAHPPFAGPPELGGDPVIVHDQHFSTGGVTFTGEWAWVVPLAIGSGGTLGGAGLLIAAAVLRRRAVKRDVPR